ncbi:class Ib ribonucleoside-diphosphate reductase assembly flavoprotein NrdI, partial [Klebsiella pneumoniae]
MSLIVYFSSRSENTHRFVQRLGLPAVRIPLNEREHLRVDEPYILIVPSYGGGIRLLVDVDHFKGQSPALHGSPGGMALHAVI